MTFFFLFERVGNSYNFTTKDCDNELFLCLAIIVNVGFDFNVFLVLGGNKCFVSENY